MVIVHRQADLLEVVRALDAPGRLPGCLHRGQQESDQDGDDGDDYQQLNQEVNPGGDLFLMTDFLREA